MVYNPDESTTATGYDLWAPVYDDHDPSTWLDEPFLLEHLKPFPGCRILDLGCGTGRYLRRLSPGLYRITAMDLSRGMLTRAGREAGSRRDIDWVQASVTALPFQLRRFDRIMSGLVIDHVEQPEHLFRQLAAVLAPAGRAVVAGVHPDMQRLTGPEIDVASEQGAARIQGHLHEVTALTKAATEAGLRVALIEEPRVTRAMIEQRPAWTRKLGCAALVLLLLLSNADG